MPATLAYRELLLRLQPPATSAGGHRRSTSANTPPGTPSSPTCQASRGRIQSAGRAEPTSSMKKRAGAIPRRSHRVVRALNAPSESLLRRRPLRGTELVEDVRR